tara:strand:- start:232 stop:792 length:561 start_codon:yes stop_codon:yes gene_type:complete
MRERFKLEIFIGEDLQGYYKFPDEARRYVVQLEEELEEVQNLKNRALHLGTIGVVHLHLRSLDKAEEYLKESIKLILDLNLGNVFKAQQSIRLANVYQWKKAFQKANGLFMDTILLCKNDDSCQGYLDFALQHYGKCLFDQSLYSEALEQFEEALRLRQSKNSPDLINSTEFAISVTKARLENPDL